MLYCGPHVNTLTLIAAPFFPTTKQKSKKTTDTTEETANGMKMEMANSSNATFPFAGCRVRGSWVGHLICSYKHTYTAWVYHKSKSIAAESVSLVRRFCDKIRVASADPENLS